MRKLVLHHRYSRGLAWDLSRHDNHGTLTDVQPGPAPFDTALQFNLPSSRIDVPASASLSHLGAFRCSVSFFLTGTNANARYNLAEGHVCFALYIDPTFELTATIVDAEGHWKGLRAPLPPAVRQGWHRVDCGHDGISTMWLAVDGTVVAVKNTIFGPVRSVGPNGLVIGHWPEPVDAFAFAGYLSEVWLWKEHPDPPVNQCCGEPAAVADAEQMLRQKGWTLEKVRHFNAELMRLAAEWRRLIPDPAGHDADRTSAQLNAALRDQRWDKVGDLARHLISQTEHHVADADRQRLADEILALFGEDLLSDSALHLALFRGFLCDVRNPGGPHPTRDDNEPAHTAADLDDEPDLDYPPGPKPATAEDDDDCHTDGDGRRPDADDHRTSGS